METFNDIVGTVIDVQFVKDGVAKTGKTYKKWKVVIQPENGNEMDFGAFGDNLEDMVGRNGKFSYKEDKFGRTLVFKKRFSAPPQNSPQYEEIITLLREINGKLNSLSLIKNVEGGQDKIPF